MKLSEIEKLDRIVARLEALARETDDSVAAQELRVAAHCLLKTYNYVLRSYKETRS